MILMFSEPINLHSLWFGWVWFLLRKEAFGWVTVVDKVSTVDNFEGRVLCRKICLIYAFYVSQLTISFYTATSLLFGRVSSRSTA